MSDEKTMKLVTNLDRAAIEAKLREVGGDAAAAGLTDLAKMFIGIEGMPGRSSSSASTTPSSGWPTSRST